MVTAPLPERQHSAAARCSRRVARISYDRCVESRFPPGASPFRAKGNVYRALLESADKRVPGGREAVLALIDDPVLRAFYLQPFLAASSYDIFPLIPFGVAGAKILGVPYGEFVRGGAEFTALRDMNGIYRVLLKLASPEMVIARIPRILAQYFDFGSVEGQFRGERSYEATARGLPKPIAFWLTNIAHGFIPVVLEKAGARRVDMRVRNPTETHVEHGVQLVDVSFDVRWE